MANPQVEEGHLKIADDLMVAILREDFKATQLRVFFAVMNMTYRAGKTKAVISQDDLRYATGMKAYKVQQATGELLDRKILWAQLLPSGERILGIQKDYELWLPKNGNAINSYLPVSNTKQPVRALPKNGNGSTPPGRILTWMLGELNVHLTLGAWRAEYSKMVKLYTEALEVAHSPREAMRAIKEQFEYHDNTSFRSKVTRPASYLLPSFKNWYREAHPNKPRQVKEDEDLLGQRYRYNLTTKQWEVTDERI